MHNSLYKYLQSPEADIRIFFQLEAPSRLCVFGEGQRERAATIADEVANKPFPITENLYLYALRTIYNSS